MAVHDTLVRVVMELSAARELRGVMATVRTAARELTGADGATFVLREGDSCYYADEDAIGRLWKGQRFAASSCISGWAMNHKEAAVVEDIYSDARIPLSAYESTFVRSLVMVPIRAADPIGAIGVYWATRYRASEEQVRLVQTLANSTAVALENVRALDEARRWRALLGEASDTVWTMDPDTGTGEMEGIARWWATTTGRPIAAYADALAWLDDLHPDDRAEVAAAWAESLRAPVPFKKEYRVLARDGCLRYVMARAVAVPRPGGTHELVGMLTDLTREREAEREVQTLLDRERLARRSRDQLLERIADGFVAIDRDWRYTYVNRRATEMLGRESAELIGQNVWTLFPEARGGLFHLAMERALATQAVVFEEHFFAPWRRWFENRIFPSETGVSIFFSDVTEKRIAQEALQEARLLLELAIQASSVGFWGWDAASCEWRTSPECKRQLGYGPDELHDSIEGRIHPSEREDVLRRLATQASIPGQSFQQELRLLHKDGVYRWVLWRASGVEPGRVQGRRVHGCQIDITELKRAHQDRERLHGEVEAEKRRLELLAECVPAGIVMVAAPSARVIFFNRRAHEIFNDSLGAVDAQLRQRCSEGVVAAGSPLDVIAEVLATQTPVLDREIGCTTREGRHTRLLASAVPVIGDKGGLEGVVGSFHDVTETHEVREELRQLSRSLLAAQDEERRRVSRDLHDDLAQVLTAVKLSLASLAPGVAPPSFDASVRNAIEIVDRSIRQTRNLSLQLYPPMLDVLGLGPTLRWHISSRLPGPLPSAHVSIDLSRERFPTEIESSCFRVVQEAITNILRHAHARRVSVDLREAQGELIVVVEDDGRGFEPAATRARAVAEKFAGLAGMQERLALAGGSFELRSKPGSGTRLSARFPIEATP